MKFFSKGYRVFLIFMNAFVADEFVSIFMLHNHVSEASELMKF